MRDRTYALTLRLLIEAVEREAHADSLVDLAVGKPRDVHVPTLRVLACSQRVRAMELRGQAAALLHPYRPGRRSGRC